MTVGPTSGSSPLLTGIPFRAPDGCIMTGEFAVRQEEPGNEDTSSQLFGCNRALDGSTC